MRLRPKASAAAADKPPEPAFQLAPPSVVHQLHVLESVRLRAHSPCAAGEDGRIAIVTDFCQVRPKSGVQPSGAEWNSEDVALRRDLHRCRAAACARTPPSARSRTRSSTCRCMRPSPRRPRDPTRSRGWWTSRHHGARAEQRADPVSLPATPRQAAELAPAGIRRLARVHDDLAIALHEIEVAVGALPRKVTIRVGGTSDRRRQLPIVVRVGEQALRRPETARARAGSTVRTSDTEPVSRACQRCAPRSHERCPQACTGVNGPDASKVGVQPLAVTTPPCAGA
jgi:hypothetical protein